MKTFAHEILELNELWGYISADSPAERSEQEKLLITLVKFIFDNSTQNFTPLKRELDKKIASSNFDSSLTEELISWYFGLNEKTKFAISQAIASGDSTNLNNQ